MGRARLVSYEHERVVAEATARRAGLLVLTDLHYPGWKVRDEKSTRATARPAI